MIEQLRILLIEDDDGGAEQLARQLRDHYAQVHMHSVRDREQLTDALRGHTWDVILSDWSPDFGALSALRLALESAADVPFILVSDAIGEESAVSAMRAGASDHVSKRSFSRLTRAIDREVRNARLRAQSSRRRADDEAIFNLSLDLLGIVGFSGHFQRLNAAWQSTLGWTEPELLAMNLDALVDPEDASCVRDAMTRLRAGEEDHVEFECRFRRKDGGVSALLWTASPVVEERRCYVAARDVSAQRALEARLRQSQKMEALGRWVGGVAHDFNNLLSVILSYSTLARAEVSPNLTVHAHIREIEAAATRAADLTNQLLAFSRQRFLQPQVLDINEILSGMERMFARLLPDEIVLSVRKGSVGKIEADRSQIEQVIMNLVLNARDAMPRGGHLTLETKDVDLEAKGARGVTGPHVSLAVSDSGAGMDAATCAQIYEPFFTTKELGCGTGLGLSTVMGIIQQSGGDIHVESAIDRGTTFSVYLPRTERERR